MNLSNHVFMAEAGDGDAGGGGGNGTPQDSAVSLLGKGDEGGPPSDGIPASPPPADAVPEFAKEFNSELQTLMATKKYGDAESLAQAYQHLTTKLGVPAERMLELPADQAADGAMADVWTALGRPETAEGYDLPNLPDGDDNAKLAIALSQKAWELGLTQAQWQGVQEGFSQIGAGLDVTGAEQRAAESAADWQKLRDTWGPDFDDNIKRGKEAVARAGIDDDVLDAIQTTKGTAGIMQWALDLSRTNGAHSMDFGGDGGPGGDGGFQNAEAARAEYNRMLGDPDVVSARNSGDAAVNARLDQLVEIMSSDPTRGGRDEMLT